MRTKFFWSLYAHNSSQFSLCITDHEKVLNIWGNIHNSLNQSEKNIESLDLAMGVRTGLAIHWDLDWQEEGADRTPPRSGREHCAALPRAGRGLAAMPVGPGAALGRRFCDSSRIRIVPQWIRKLFTKDAKQRTFLEVWFSPLIFNGTITKKLLKGKVENSKLVMHVFNSLSFPFWKIFTTVYYS